MYAITMFKIELHEKSSQFKLPILKQYHNSSKHKRPFGLKYLLLMCHPTQGSKLIIFHNCSLEAILHISWCSIRLWNKAPRQFGKSHHGMINTIHTLATAKECLHYSIVVLNNCIMHILLSTSKTSFEFMFLVIYSLVQFDSTTIYILYVMKYFMHMLSKFYRKIKLVHYLAFTLLVVFIQYIMTSWDCVPLCSTYTIWL